MSHREQHEPERADRGWIEVVARVYAPEPLDPLRARAFDQRLLVQLEPRRRTRRLAIPLLAAAAGALALWLRTEPAVDADVAPSALYAFADPDLAIGLVEPDAYLPDDYRLLASYLDPEAAER